MVFAENTNIKATRKIKAVLLLIAKLTAEMKNAAKLLEFEHAAYLRDKIKKLQNERFVQNAPAQVVEMERKKLADAESKIAAL